MGPKNTLKNRPKTQTTKGILHKNLQKNDKNSTHLDGFSRKIYSFPLIKSFCFQLFSINNKREEKNSLTTDGVKKRWENKDLKNNQFIDTFE